MFDRVVTAAEAAGFEYMLVPVASACWDAYIASAVVIGRSRSIRMLVAARPGYVNPVRLGKMTTAFAQLSGGLVAVHLTAWPRETDTPPEAIRNEKPQSG